MKKNNLLRLKNDGIDITSIESVSKAIDMYEKLPFYRNEKSKTRTNLETEILIRKLREDGKISIISEYCFRMLPIGLRIKMLHEEMDFRASFVSVFYGDTIDEPLVYYYDDKRKQSENILDGYRELKNSSNKGEYVETHLDTLRKQKIKLMRRNK